MVSVWEEPRENLELIEELEIPSTRRLPAIVWLTHHAEQLLRCIVPSPIAVGTPPMPPSKRPYRRAAERWRM